MVKWAGLAGTRMHDLRHTCASIAVPQGQTLPVIGAMLGHTQPQTTARYAHLFDDPLLAAAEPVGASLTLRPSKVPDAATEGRSRTAA
jgi:integrase